MARAGKRHNLWLLLLLLKHSSPLYSEISALEGQAVRQLY